VRIAALFSGGKDSTYSIYLMKKLGHDVVSLLTMIPSFCDSMLFHYPNIGMSPYLAEAMALPLHQFNSFQSSTDAEANVLSDALKFMRSEYGIDGIVHGGISSYFQKNVFEKSCQKFGLSVFSPVWHTDPKSYMHELLSANFSVVVTSVSCLGLDSSWLGCRLYHDKVNKMEKITSKYVFNMNFEGCEA
jgi:diphthine-ammonia ligase